MTELSHNSIKPYLASVPSVPQEAPEAEPLPVPVLDRYPQSTLSLRLRLGNIEMSWTLRGKDADVARRIPRALATIRDLQAKGTLPAAPEQPAASQAEPATPQPPLDRSPGQALEDRADWCKIHHVAMVLQTNEKGSWYSHRLPEGGFCKGKRKRAGA